MEGLPGPTTAASGATTTASGPTTAEAAIVVRGLVKRYGERAVVDGLDLTAITLVCQDWGGLVGLRRAAEHPARFARLVLANTGLPIGETKDNLKASIANFRDVSDKLASGKGTLGKLISDDSLYLSVQSTMKKADRAIDGLGDSGPITAVGVVAGKLF